MSEDISIGLQNDQLMQRFLARRIYREIELRLVEMDNSSTVGFVTGFDDRCIQVSTSPVLPADEPRSVLLFWPLKRIEETGARIDSLEPDARAKVRSSNSVLREQCEQTLRKNGSLRSNRPGARAR